MLGFTPLSVFPISQMAPLVQYPGAGVLTTTESARGALTIIETYRGTLILTEGI